MGNYTVVSMKLKDQNIKVLDSITLDQDYKRYIEEWYENEQIIVSNIKKITLDPYFKTHYSWLHFFFFRGDYSPKYN